MTSKTIAVYKSTRPPFLILTPICVLLGVAVALQDHGSVNISLTILVLLGALSAHISANTFNEYFDFASGLDNLTVKTPFSGGSGGIPEAPAAHKTVLTLAIVTLLLTVIIGIYLVNLKGLLLLGLGVIGVITIVLYTRWINRIPLLCLIAPGLAFGPLFVLGTYISITQPELVNYRSLASVLIVSLVPFFLVNNLLLINQIPDIDADKQVNRKTFPIIFGMQASINMYLIFSILTALTVVASVVLNITHEMTLFTIIPLLISVYVYYGFLKEKFVIEKVIFYMGINITVTLLTIAVFSALIIFSSINIM